MVRRLFTAAAVGWAGALPLAAWIAGRSDASPLYAFALSVYAVGALVCHQIPARSFHLWSTRMPVCARCAGIYAGAAMAAIAATILRVSSARLASQARARSGRRLAARTLLSAAALPTVATLAYEWITGQTPANWIRALAGLPIGAVAAWLIVWSE